MKNTSFKYLSAGMALAAACILAIGASWNYGDPAVFWFGITATNSSTAAYVRTSNGWITVSGGVTNLGLTASQYVWANANQALASTLDGFMWTNMNSARLVWNTNAATANTVDWSKPYSDIQQSGGTYSFSSGYANWPGPTNYAYAVVVFKNLTPASTILVTLPTQCETNGSLYVTNWSAFSFFCRSNSYTNCTIGGY